MKKILRVFEKTIENVVVGITIVAWIILPLSWMFGFSTLFLYYALDQKLIVNGKPVSLSLKQQFRRALYHFLEGFFPFDEEVPDEFEFVLKDNG